MLAIIKKIVVLFTFSILIFPNFVKAVSYTPSVQDIFIEPGESNVVNFFIFDKINNNLTYNVSLLNVDIKKDGSMSFSDLPVDDLKYSLSTNVLQIKQNEVMPLELKIKTTKETKSGLRVVGVKISEQNNQQDNIQVRTEIISLVFITVGGNLKRDLIFKKIATNKKFVSSLPIEMELNFENNGDLVVQPVGNILIKNIFGKTIDTLTVNNRKKRVLPNQSRSFLVKWGSNYETRNFIGALKNESRQFKIGVYKISADIIPWEGSETLSKSVTVYIFPWRLTLVFFSSFSIILILFWKIRKK